MPQVKYAPGAIRDLQRLREFLRPKNPAAAKRAGEAILKAVQVLGQQPHIGRPIEEMPEEYREWLIDFGDSGYVAWYRIDADTVTILAVRHQKEAGY
ncbi:MAG: type II toxin-antitoxin system RelE/ParE family toxin [Chitinimonas sp.]|nr:type II toxin-antitoxin system RelE/ParE family toxin [Chitinimonas sp.]